MRHYTKEQWVAYANSEEIDRSSMDDHLLECEQCLALYVDAVNVSAELMPELDNQDAFVADIMVSLQQPKEIPNDRFRWLKHPMLHYVIAASVTLVLISSGAFQQLFDQASQWTRESEGVQSKPITQQWTDKASRLLDGITFNSERKDEIR